MLSFFAKIALVSTSLAPVLITYGLSRLSEQGGWQYVLFALAGLLVLLNLCLLRFIRSKLRVIELKLSSVRNADQEILAFILTYLLPLAGTSDQQTNLPVVSFVFVLIFVAVFASNSYHFNPLLGLFRYHFYEVTTNDNVTLILLTKKRLRGNPQNRFVVEISDYLLMEID